MKENKINHHLLELLRDRRNAAIRNSSRALSRRLVVMPYRNRLFLCLTCRLAVDSPVSDLDDFILAHIIVKILD